MSLAVSGIVFFLLFFILFHILKKQKSQLSRRIVDFVNVQGNVVLYVDGKIAHGEMGFFNFKVNNMEIFQVFPRSPIGIDLEPGMHTILVSYPHMGNDKYPATTQIEVKRGTKYQVLYTYPSIVLSPANISIREII